MSRAHSINGGRRKAEGGDSALSFPLPPSALRLRGISLIEVLISMFVLLFGLMGVAAIFPVASHYILEGDKRDRSSGLAQIAFEELKARKLLKPTQWVLPSNIQANLPGTALISPTGTYSGYFVNPFDPGLAFVIDPLASAIPIPGSDQTLRTAFPAKANGDRNTAPGGWPALRHPANPPITSTPMPLTNWPVRRMSLDVNPNVVNNTVMSSQTAETAFTLRDELVTQQPDAGDRPSVQLWRKGNNNTPTNPNDDVMLSRQFNGNYTWLATVVPTRQNALLGLQHAAGIRDEFYEVTSVVFYKRNTAPSATVTGSAGSERLIGAEFLNSGELALYDYDTGTGHPETVDTAVDGLKPTNWIAVCGVNQITGMFMLKWYKILAMDDSTDTIQINSGNVQGRYLMVDGPEWPSGSYGNLRAIILPGAIDAYTRVMQIEQE